MSHQALIVPDGLDQKISDIWSRTSNQTLSDGQLLSVSAIDTQEISVSVVPYRYWYAQATYGIGLGVRPLAITGVIRVRGGFAMGIRRSDSMEDPSMWEFVPSGSVDPQLAGDSGDLSPADQVYIEAEEELSLDSDQLSTPTFLTCLENKSSGVVDLVYEADLVDDAARFASEAEEGYLPEHEVLAVVSKPWAQSFAVHCSPLASTIASILAEA